MESLGQMAALTLGQPRMNRNQRRMFEFNSKRQKEFPAPSGEERKPYDHSRTEHPSRRPSGRSLAWKGKAGKFQRRRLPEATKVETPTISDPIENGGVVKAKREVLIDHQLWDTGPFLGTHPTQRLYSQNMDHSTFPLLLEKVYASIENEEPRIRREMPFCAFQHVYTGVLNATMIDHVRVVNAEDRFTDEESPLNLIPEDLIIPGPISDYLKMLANSTSPQGDTIKMNVPEGGIPQEPVPEEGDRARIPSGSFGVADAASHNAYECYVSPLITARLIEATIAQNTDRRYRAWAPLPAGCFPAGCVPTSNLLGYKPNVERLTPEGMQAILDATYAEGANMAGRLKWSPELVARVSGTLKRLETKFRCVQGRPQRGTNPAPTGWVTVDAIPAVNSGRLSVVCAPVYCESALGPSQCNVVGLLGLKRERTATARGLCYVTAQDAAPPGWEDTVNSNFTMTAPFQPMVGLDLPLLREKKHVNAAPSGDRGLSLTTWIGRCFKHRRD
jgi:hypothetical protein